MPQSPPNWMFVSVQQPQPPPPSSLLSSPFALAKPPGPTGPVPLAYGGPVNFFVSYYYLALARTAASKVKYEYDQIYPVVAPAEPKS